MTLTFSQENYGNLLPHYLPKVIRTESENEQALATVEELMQRRDRSTEENELYELLIVLIEKFEQEFYQPGASSTPHSMLQFLLEQQGLKTADLLEILGSETQVSETLKGNHDLTIAQIKALSQLFGVAPAVFL